MDQSPAEDANPPVANPAPATIPLVASESALLTLLAGPQPVLVLFDAGWRGTAPAAHEGLAALAQEEPALAVVRVDVDALPAVPARYGVQGVPTLVLFRDGQIVSSRIGETRGPEIALWLDQNLHDQA